MDRRDVGNEANVQHTTLYTNNTYPTFANSLLAIKIRMQKKYILQKKYKGSIWGRNI